jgi:putative ATPase
VSEHSPYSRRPLAEELRPKSINELAGLEQLDAILVQSLKNAEGRAPSVILWGPPGSGKTTLAKLIGRTFRAEFVELSAVQSGVKDIRDVVERSRGSLLPVVLFLDEIHRFNKAQQDAFLPHVESGTFSLIGATTENPSFSLTGALLSRCRVVVMPPINDQAMASILERAGRSLGIELATKDAELFIQAASGDARRLLNMLENFAQWRSRIGGDVADFLKDARLLQYDRSGDHHYDIASALIKSLRGSDPDAALYWGFRMLESGEDPRFVIRRLIIFASEDIGNADPRALQIAVSTLDAYQLIGLPEGRIPIAQCITYLATAPKSNRSYIAMHRAIAAIGGAPAAAVPLHLRNAPTGLMKSLNYGADYVSPHDRPAGYAAGERYLPDGVTGGFYEPSDRGYEKTIGERLAWLRSLGLEGH